jgi:hypothetical protein
VILAAGAEEAQTKAWRPNFNQLRLALNAFPRAATSDATATGKHTPP